MSDDALSPTSAEAEERGLCANCLHPETCHLTGCREEYPYPLCSRYTPQTSLWATEVLRFIH